MEICQYVTKYLTKDMIKEEHLTDYVTITICAHDRESVQKKVAAFGYETQAQLDWNTRLLEESGDFFPFRHENDNDEVGTMKMPTGLVSTINSVVKKKLQEYAR